MVKPAQRETPLSTEKISAATFFHAQKPYPNPSSSRCRGCVVIRREGQRPEEDRLLKIKRGRGRL